MKLSTKTVGVKSAPGVKPLPSRSGGCLPSCLRREPPEGRSAVATAKARDAWLSNQ